MHQRPKTRSRNRRPVERPRALTWVDTLRLVPRRTYLAVAGIVLAAAATVGLTLAPTRTPPAYTPPASVTSPVELPGSSLPLASPSTQP